MLEVPNTPEKPKLGLESLQAVLDFLKESGFDVAVSDIGRAKKYLIDMEDGLPLVRDGLDGIRAEYEPDEDTLKIYFTNSFEKPENERRKLVQNWLEENYSLK